MIAGTPFIIFANTTERFLPWQLAQLFLKRRPPNETARGGDFFFDLPAPATSDFSAPVSLDEQAAKTVANIETNNVLPIAFIRCMMLAVPIPFHKKKRVVEPEILDALPADDPAAIRSRRDLRLVNTLMGNQRWIIKQLRQSPAHESGRTSWELGAGDGSLGAAIAKKLGNKAPPLTALDLSPRSERWPTAWDWQQRDLMEIAAESPNSELVIANLILHHFDDAQLASIGRWLSAEADTVIAVEPLRARLPHVLAFAMRLLGINYVTREDIHTSINAGFTDSELPDLLGLDPQHWNIQVSTTLLGAYQMIATRRP